MRRLFWRIFAAFWLAMVVLILALVWITTRNFETEKIPGLEVTRLQATMDDQLARVARDLRRNGPDGPHRWLRASDDRGPVRLFLLDDGGHDLLGRRVPADAADAARTALLGLDPADPVRDAVAADPDSDRVRLRLVILRDGRRYAAVAVFDGSSFGRLLYHRPFTFWSHIGVALVISTLVSLLLAFYVAHPLGRIRSSMRSFAEGDLDSRVGRLRFGRSAEMTGLAGEFDRMAERIKALVENNRRLVRDVSHELRSPLARLRVALELAREGEPAEARRSLDRIDREADRLEAMLAQAIELSRLETATEPRRERIALDELLGHAITNADYEGAPRGRKVVLAASAPIRLHGAPDALYSAVENIIRNALAYTADGTTVEVALQRDAADPGIARIVVRDHGPGVPEGELVRIFDPFYRTDAARTRSSGGTGLGLAIARRAVVNHGGHIIACNAEGGGLEVTISLPVDA